MARVTVEDCLLRVPNRFALTMLAAERARHLAQRRTTPFIQCDNKPAVTALREIAAGEIFYLQELRAEIEKYLEDLRQRGSKVSHRRELPVPRAALVSAEENSDT